MDYIRFAISNPVKVTVAVLLLLLFGLIGLFTIPIQLTPNVDQPVITVETAWTGRSPEEVERDVIEEQEDKLKGVTNLRKMTSTAYQGRGRIELEFYVGTHINRVLQEVSDKLREVPEYPNDVDQPVITAAEAAEEQAIAWMVLTSDEPNFEVPSLFEEVDRRIKPYLERIEGLSQVNIYGGREHQVHIQVDPRRLAERGITFNQLRSALRLENVNVSAGDLAEGRLDVRVRTVGQYEDLESVRNTIVTYGPGGPIRVKDLAEVELSLEKRRAFVRSKGQPALAINAIRETGANVVSVMSELRQRLDVVRRDMLPSLGPQLKLQQVYDETIYIEDALALVTDNLWQGGVLVVLVLLLFLRRARSPALVLLALVVILICGVTALLTSGLPHNVAITGIAVGIAVIALDSPPTAIISLSIPLSVIGTFVVLAALGRNLNVVSLAGLAFAVGMVVDNAVVVLENIDRHIGMGKTVVRAAYEGAREVGLAILASTATTLVVFIPVLTLQEEAGQLFLDISLAICGAVALSLAISITVIPTAAARWLHPLSDHEAHRKFNELWGIAVVLDRLRNRIADLIYRLCGSWPLRLTIVGAFTIGSLLAAWLLMPPTTYLPSGNRNLVFGLLISPPGYNIQQNEFIADRVESMLRPYWQARDTDATAKLPPVIDFASGQPVHPPPIDTYFFVSWSGNVFMGSASADKAVVQPLATLMTTAMNGIPGSFGFAQQISLFGRGLGGTNTLDVEILGDDLDALRHSAGLLYARLIGKYDIRSIRPDPLNFNLASPELRVQIDRVRAADLGVDVAALGLGVQALVDGAIVGDYRYRGESIDLLLTRDPAYPLQPDTLDMVPVAVHAERGGGTVPLSSIAKVVHSESPQQIKRVEQRRAVTLTVVPPPSVPLEQATQDVQEMVAAMRGARQLDPRVEVELAGTADKLVQVRESFLGQWHGFGLATVRSLIMSRMFLAFFINYLVMVWLFNSFLHPFVILFTIPLATVGGFLGLRITHSFVPTQLLDLVTMLGFIVLMGTVVNNAILLVAQALNFMKGFGESELDRLEKAMPPREAIRESVRTRMRPVFMTAITTVCGMLPLVIKPGAGSELYRGMGSVIVGGFIVATVFTLLVVPLLFSLVIDLKVLVYRRLGWPVAELNELEQLAAEPAPAAAPAPTAVAYSRLDP